MDNQIIKKELIKLVDAQVSPGAYSYTALHNFYLLFCENQKDLDYINQYDISEYDYSNDENYEAINNIMKYIIKEKGVEFILDKIALSNRLIVSNVLSWCDYKILLNTQTEIIKRRNAVLDKNANEDIEQIPNSFYLGEAEYLKYFLYSFNMYNPETKFPNKLTLDELKKSVIADRFMCDTYDNMMINLKTISSFFNKPAYQKQIALLEPKIKKEFEFLCNLNEKLTSQELSDTTFKPLYSKLLNVKNIPAIVYDCISTAKHVVALEYKKQCSNPEDFPEFSEKDKKTYLSNLTVPKGVRIYNSTNKPFKLFVTCIDSLRDYGKMSDCNRVSNSDVSSASFISDTSNNTFYNLNDYVTFGYYLFDEDDLLMANQYDNICYYTALTYNGISPYPYSVKTPNEMLDYCCDKQIYNEFNFYNPSSTSNNQKTSSITKPNCLVCYNKITQHEINIANNFNIPILFRLDKEYVFNNTGCYNPKPNEPIYDRTLL